MSQVSLPRPTRLLPRENGHLGMPARMPDQRDIRVSAIIIRELGSTRRELTTAVQRIKRNAQQLATSFNEPEVTEGLLVLAILLDPDGFKEVDERKIAVQRAHGVCIATLNRFREATEANPNGPPPLSDRVERVFELAREQAHTREADISLVSVKDLVNAIQIVSKGTSGNNVLAAFQPRPKTWARSVRTIAGAILVCGFGLASAIGLLFREALLAWNWTTLVSWFA